MHNTLALVLVDKPGGRKANVVGGKTNSVLCYFQNRD